MPAPQLRLPFGGRARFPPDTAEGRCRDLRFLYILPLAELQKQVRKPKVNHSPSTRTKATKHTKPKRNKTHQTEKKATYQTSRFPLLTPMDWAGRPMAVEEQPGLWPVSYLPRGHHIGTCVHGCHANKLSQHGVEKTEDKRSFKKRCSQCLSPQMGTAPDCTCY